MELVAIRAVLAAMIVFALLAGAGRKPPGDKAAWRLGAVMAVTNLAVPFVLFTLAYQNASAGFVGILVALVPLATAVFAHFLLPDEPLYLAKFGGLLVAFGGVGFLLLSGDSGLGESGRPLLAAVLALGAVASIGHASVYAKRRTAASDPLELTGMQFAIGSVAIAGVMLVFEGWPEAVSAWGWTLIVYMTVAGSVMPFLLFYWLLRHVTATTASLIGYIVPLVALTSGILVADERLEFGIALGGALVLTGVILTDWTERRRRHLAPTRVTGGLRP